MNKEVANNGERIMKAVICTKYGEPEGLQKAEVKKPVQKKDNEVLIKIYATSVHIGDTRIRRADPFLGVAQLRWASFRV